LYRFVAVANYAVRGTPTAAILIILKFFLPINIIDTKGAKLLQAVQIKPPQMTNEKNFLLRLLTRKIVCRAGNRLMHTTEI